MCQSVGSQVFLRLVATAHGSSFQYPESVFPDIEALARMSLEGDSQKGI